MPIPAIVGIPALIAFFTTLATKLFDFFIERTIKAFLVASAIISVVALLINQLIGLIGGHLANLLTALPQWPPELVPLFFPASVAKTCLTIVITAELIVTYSSWSVWLFKLGKRSFRR